jgi:3-deoxy-D-manno-octulosonic-acid transferase
MVRNKDELVVTLTELFNDADEARELGQRGLALLEENRGALARLLELLEPLLAEQSRA